MRAVVSSHISTAPSSSLLPCMCGGSLPQDSVFHELFQCGSFLWVAVLQELPQYGSSVGSVLQEQADSACVSLEGSEERNVLPLEEKTCCI